VNGGLILFFGSYAPVSIPFLAMINSRDRVVELLEHLRRQFAYDQWANREVLAGLKASAGETAGPLKLLAHIVSAERLWLERIRKKPQSMPVWPELNFGTCEAEISSVAQLWDEYLGQSTVATLSQEITYENSRGEPWSSSVEEILTHVLMHSAYHRGQIASQVRAGGEQPAYTDFIHAARK
jgi:uncharacterized damage-inducible protein DinB